MISQRSIRAVIPLAAGILGHSFGAVQCSTVAMISRGVSMADPAKNGHGEDEMFIASRHIGVFDGVGGWKDSGIDPSIYFTNKLTTLGTVIAPDP